MCGIVGVVNTRELPAPAPDLVGRMLALIRHRGPDEFGIYHDDWAGLGSARLSIIDLSGGQQPIGNEDGTLWIVFNGEIFNYLELRPELERRGHRFTTNCDTEIILHLYEDYGPACLNYLNGQFAIAIWDMRQRRLFLARDRVGIRPLFYTLQDNQLIFGSEIKALFAHPAVAAEIQPEALAQVFTFWSTLAPHTIFRNIHELPPGHYLSLQDGELKIEPYWTLNFAEEQNPHRTADDYLDEFEQLLIDATLIRLRADVPVGAYLSGGLDSSVTTALIRKHTHNRLDTFSIAFSDPAFDESDFQRRMAHYLGTDHQVVYCTPADIGRVFPEVIWHTETPTVRTAPAPMFLLSQLVHDHNFKVVMTGEGADELLGGYDIFKEMVIRRFWAKDPASTIRPLLLKRLYPEIGQLNSASGAFLMAFFKRGLTATDTVFYSHAIRWNNAVRLQRFMLNPNPANHLEDEVVPLPPDFERWSHFGQAQYLEMVTFLSPYLLSSQGDRVAMGHSVEGRYPFLDYRIVEFCGRLPARYKMRGLREKWLLRQVGRQLLPPEIWTRRKRPYRAPIHRSFFGAEETPAYVQELLGERAIQDAGLFNPQAVAQLVHKALSGVQLSEVDDMAVAGILSSQLVYQQFVKDFNTRLSELRSTDRVKMVQPKNKEIAQ